MAVDEENAATKFYLNILPLSFATTLVQNSNPNSMTLHERNMYKTSTQFEHKDNDISVAVW